MINLYEIDYITFSASDGTTHSVPTNQLAAAREIVPNLVVLENDPMVFFRIPIYFGKREAMADS